MGEVFFKNDSSNDVCVISCKHLDVASHVLTSHLKNDVASPPLFDVPSLSPLQPENLRFFKDETPLEDSKNLSDYGYTSSTARAQAPATVGMVYKNDRGRWGGGECGSRHAVLVM